VRSVEPVGHPKSALVCGGKSRGAPGPIWLEPQDAVAYDSGQRVFEAFVSSAMKMRAQ